MDRAWDERNRLEPAEERDEDVRGEDSGVVWVVDMRSHRVVRQKPRIAALVGRDR